MQQEGTAQSNERAYEQEPVTDVIAKREIPAGTTPIIEPASLWGEEPEEAVIKEPVAVKESSPQGARVSAPGGEAVAGEVQPVINFKEKLGSFGAAVGYIAGTVASLASAAGNKFVSKVGEVIEQKRVANSTDVVRYKVESAVGDLSSTPFNKIIKEMNGASPVDATADSSEVKRIKKQMSKSNGDFLASLGEMYRSTLQKNNPGDIRNNAAYRRIRSSSFVKLASMAIGVSAFFVVVGSTGLVVAAVLGYLNYTAVERLTALAGAHIAESDFVKDKVARFRGEKLRAHSIVSGSPENSQKPSPAQKM